MTDIKWWHGTAIHIWKAYFAMKRNNVSTSGPDDSVVNRKITVTCDHILQTRFSPLDRDIIESFFSAPYGSELRTVENYSITHNVSIELIWKVVKRAYRIVAEEYQLLEKKEGVKNDTGKWNEPVR